MLAALMLMMRSVRCPITKQVARQFGAGRGVLPLGGNPERTRAANRFQVFEQQILRGEASSIPALARNERK